MLCGLFLRWFWPHSITGVSNVHLNQDQDLNRHAQHLHYAVSNINSFIFQKMDHPNFFIFFEIWNTLFILRAKIQII